MINLHAFINALKCTWIRRICKNDGKWRNIFLSYVDKDRFFSCGYSYVKQLQQSIKNKFWKDVLGAWQMVIENEINLHDWEYFLSSPIWMNNLFQIDNKPVFFKDWHSKGILHVNDIVVENCTFLKFYQFQECFQMDIDIMKYNSIIPMLTKTSKKINKGDYKLVSPFIQSVIKTILKSKKGSKDMYLVLNKTNTVPTELKRWEAILVLEK